MASKAHVTKDEEFDPTYTGGLQERQWLLQSLRGFYEDGWLSDVLFRVQGGKEATVYCCRANPATGYDLIAAKVFRPRMFRAMRNYAIYKEGRGYMAGEGKGVGRDGSPAWGSRSAKAIRKKTRFGRLLDTASWCLHEYGALSDLYEAGASVPKPLEASPNALLMEFVGDEDGAAPLLQSVALEPDEAQSVFDQVIRSVEAMLMRFRVHGDLSAYNVLYWRGQALLIDFPQVVDALHHPTAFTLFHRDIDRLCGYFTRQGLELDPVGLARDLWERFIG